MFIDLSKNKTLKEIEEEFSVFFPYLKIKLYNKPPSSDEFAKTYFSSYSTVDDLNLYTKPGKMQVNNSKTAAQFQKAFANKFGLYAEVFRKHDDEWISITEDDNLTLKEQNEIGRHRCCSHEEETRFEDFMETEF